MNLLTEFKRKDESLIVSFQKHTLKFVRQTLLSTDNCCSCEVDPACFLYQLIQEYKQKGYVCVSINESGIN